MADLATIADVKVRWRPGVALDGATGEQIQALITAASAMVRQSVPGIDAAILAGSVQTDLVTQVVAEAVARVMRNPNGVVSTATGPFSEQYGPGPFGLYLSESDLAVLRQRPTTVAGPIGTVGLGHALGGYCPPANYRLPAGPPYRRVW